MFLKICISYGRVIRQVSKIFRRYSTVSFISQFFISFSKPGVNLIHRTAGIRLRYVVLYTRCSIVSSSSARYLKTLSALQQQQQPWCNSLIPTTVQVNKRFIVAVLSVRREPPGWNECFRQYVTYLLVAITRRQRRTKMMRTFQRAICFIRWADRAAK